MGEGLPECDEGVNVVCQSTVNECMQLCVSVCIVLVDLGFCTWKAECTAS